MGDKTIEELEPLIDEICNSGGTYWVKFTCKHCGARQTFEQQRTFYTSGRCEECNQVTILQKYGLLALR